MKRCLACDARFASAIRACPVCGSSPVLVDGFDAYAPELAHGSDSFHQDHFAELCRLEHGSFWFRSRNQLILWALERYCPDFRSLLEVGCGTGYVLSAIAEKFPRATLNGSEILTVGLGCAAARLQGVRLMQMDAARMPFSEEFDVIGAFDVLEHIDDDRQVLAQLREALKPAGLLLLTVPQHKWLWSAVDEGSCHRRRYAAPDLHRKIEGGGFRIVRSTSFVATLLPVMMASRLFRRAAADGKLDMAAAFKVPASLNSLFALILGAELSAIREGIDFPFGGSRLVIAQKAEAV
ncbi:MAG: methyltransferase domain-containing protein [Nevskia sp.]|nr:methyltransferase domain-containing protein [Nevskia sp.]